MANKVIDRESFVEFLKQFISEIDNFENKSLDDFIEAMTRYTEDIDGYYKNTNQTVNLKSVNWNVFADILKGASMYE